MGIFHQAISDIEEWDFSILNSKEQKTPIVRHWWMCDHGRFLLEFKEIGGHSSEGGAIRKLAKETDNVTKKNLSARKSDKSTERKEIVFSLQRSSH